MESQRWPRALRLFLAESRHEGAGKDSASWIVGDLRVLLARDCRGRFGRLEIWGASPCTAPGPLASLADWERIAEGGLWIGQGQDGTRFLWRPDAGHLRWTPRVSDSTSTHRRQVFRILQALDLLTSNSDPVLS